MYSFAVAILHLYCQERMLLKLYLSLLCFLYCLIYIISIKRVLIQIRYLTQAEEGTHSTYMELRLTNVRRLHGQ